MWAWCFMMMRAFYLPRYQFQTSFSRHLKVCHCYIQTRRHGDVTLHHGKPGRHYLHVLQRPIPESQKSLKYCQVLEWKCLSGGPLFPTVHCDMKHEDEEERQNDVSLSPDCSQSTSHSRHGPFVTRRQSFVWHDIMTLWLSWHFLLFTVTHDTCDVTRSMSSWHSASGGMSSPICQAQNISIKIFLPSFSRTSMTSVKLYFPWVDTKYELGQKNSVNTLVCDNSEM